MIRSHPQVCLGRVVRPPGPRFPPPRTRSARGVVGSGCGPSGRPWQQSAEAGGQPGDPKVGHPDAEPLCRSPPSRIRFDSPCSFQRLTPWTQRARGTEAGRHCAAVPILRITQLASRSGRPGHSAAPTTVLRTRPRHRAHQRGAGNRGAGGPQSAQPQQCHGRRSDPPPGGRPRVGSRIPAQPALVRSSHATRVSRRSPCRRASRWRRRRLRRAPPATPTVPAASPPPRPSRWPSRSRGSRHWP